MKVIFLDVDGVLNSDEYFEKVFNLIKSGAKIQGIERNIDVNKVKLLKEATDLTDAKVVLSTSVRYSQMGEMIKELLLKYGISVISETTFLNNERGKEIREWLEEHTGIEDFVILDDEIFSSYDEELLKKLIKISNGGGKNAGEGLSKKDIEEIIKRLGRKIDKDYIYLEVDCGKSFKNIFNNFCNFINCYISRYNTSENI